MTRDARLRRLFRLAVVAALAAAAFAASSAPPLRSAAGAVRAARAAAPSPRFRYRYLFSSDRAVAMAAANGWNLIDVGSKSAADALPGGERGLVWVGDYDNTTCDWQVPDASLRAQVAPMATDPKVAGFFYSDEPDPSACAAAPAQHRARSALIHSLSPRTFTVMVADSNSGKATLDQIPLWRGAADYVALDPYPCYRGKPCDFAWIDKVIAAADAARLPYWGVVQAFADSDWRWPTVSEERRMLSQWRASRAVGSMVFSWTWAGNTLSSQPALLKVLAQFNHGVSATAAPKRGARPAKVAPASPAREVHYTFTGPRSVAFDWVGSTTSIRYGRTAHYTSSARARTPKPLPFSSRGPFRESRLGGLAPGTRYHYSIGGGPDRTFATAPTGPFRFDFEADVGDTASFSRVGPTQAQIAADRPAFVIVAGDLTYGNDDGQAAVDRHFDDVMPWSRTAAYMPAWGNHEWDESTDDLRNYKGRFAVPNARAAVGAPTAGCCGEDWGWFDAGGVRFISYPEPYADGTWPAWAAAAGRLMAAAQADPRIHFIVTFGHRPAYSSGYHAGETQLAAILDAFGDRYSKYVLNLNGHSHDYERFQPIHHVVHVTAGGGGSELEPPWRRSDPRTAFRAMHLEHLRVDVTASSLVVDAVCGPPSPDDDMTCRAGDVIDSVTIPARG